MALDKDGNPIPVYVPPPPAPPAGRTSNPEVENEVARLTGHVETLLSRVKILEDKTAEVPQMQLRIGDLKTAEDAITRLTERFAVVEEAFAGMPKLLERLALVERATSHSEAADAALNRKIDDLERRLLELWKEGHVHPVPPA
jgi:hypothetical protein